MEDGTDLHLNDLQLSDTVLALDRSGTEHADSMDHNIVPPSGRVAVSDTHGEVDRLFANASDFGTSTIVLSDSDGDGNWDGMFTVDIDQVPATGLQSVTIEASDSLGNSAFATTTELAITETTTVSDGQPGFGFVLVAIVFILISLRRATRES